MPQKKSTVKKTKVKLILKPSTKKRDTTTKKAKKLVLRKKPKLVLKKKMEEPKVWNNEFVALLGKLYGMMVAKGEGFRGRAYKKAQETILSISEPITSVDQLKGKPGIGATILSKLNEYVSTGTLKLLEREKNNPIYIFTQVYGIGPKKQKNFQQSTTLKLLQS